MSTHNMLRRLRPNRSTSPLSLRTRSQCYHYTTDRRVPPSTTDPPPPSSSSSASRWPALAIGLATGGLLWYYYREPLHQYIHDYVAVHFPLSSTSPQEQSGNDDNNSDTMAVDTTITQLAVEDYRRLVGWTWLKPAVYLWGSNQHRQVDPQNNTATSKNYAVLDKWDGRPLRQLLLGDKLAVAVDEQGDVYLWGEGYSTDVTGPQATLVGKDIRQVAVTQDKLFALSCSGELYMMYSARDRHAKTPGLLSPDLISLPTSSTGTTGTSSVLTPMASEQSSWVSQALSWLWPLSYFNYDKSYDVQSNQGGDFVSTLRQSSTYYNMLVRTTTDGWKPGEMIREVVSGDHHVCLLTNHGRVWTAASDLQGNDQGQLGRGPEADLVKMPSSAVEENSSHSSLSSSNSALWLPHSALNPTETQPKSILPTVRFQAVAGLPRDIDQVACGSRHTVARSARGEVYGFGANDFGQLALGLYAEGKRRRLWPTQIMSLWPRTGRPVDAQCVQVAAGGDNTYFIIKTPPDTLNKPKVSTTGTNTSTTQLLPSVVYQVFACGNGQEGKLGNHHYTHVQGVPVKIKTLSDLTEYSDQLQRTVPIQPTRLVTCATHTVAILGESTKDDALLTLDRGIRHNLERLATGIQDATSGHDVLAWGNNRQGACHGLHSGYLAKPSAMTGLKPPSELAMWWPEYSTRLASLTTMPWMQLSPLMYLTSGNPSTVVYQDVAVGPHVTAVYLRVRDI
ncbi:hypothetical protein IWQ61_009475 [Dispira simplex]|nr:hypothetical protein IWQ61_009475 [Dispira simplex]